MASDPDRRNDPGDRQNNEPNPPNPFIRFRQFADAQVGSFLQGLIGLPSTFSKNTSGNTRWADFDDDLRRRDDLQTRQKQLKNADAPWNQQDACQEGNIPVQKWRGHSSSHDTPDAPPMDKSTAEAIPLYSPVHKSLFSHLPQLGDNELDFKPSNLLNNIQKGLLPSYFPFILTPSQKSSDFMTTIQYATYNQLNSNPLYHSNYSLLPYILFSPYSPLKLDHDADHLLSTSKPDNLPYTLAFEDLIMNTHGRSALNLPFPYSRAECPRDGLSFISLFHGIGILQQKEAKSMKEEITWDFPTASPTLQKIKSHYEHLGPDTEQDMYNWFLRSVSSPEGIADAVESVVGTIFEKGELAQLMKDIKSMHAITTPEGRQGLRDTLSSSSNKDIRELMVELERIGLLPPASERKDVSDQSKSEFITKTVFTSEPDTETEPESESTTDFKTKTEVTEYDDQVESTTQQPTASGDPNKVISTVTNTKHYAKEDGSVDTTVTVWKTYGDGRETCTETRQITNKPGYVDGEWEKKVAKKGWLWK